MSSAGKIYRLENESNESNESNERIMKEKVTKKVNKLIKPS